MDTHTQTHTHIHTDVHTETLLRNSPLEAGKSEEKYPKRTVKLNCLLYYILINTHHLTIKTLTEVKICI